jgi:hypothetical protein
LRFIFLIFVLSHNQKYKVIAQIPVEPKYNQKSVEKTCEIKENDYKD